MNLDLKAEAFFLVSWCLVRGTEGTSSVWRETVGIWLEIGLQEMLPF